jgi:RNA 3'-terminal phosphate cyclase (ATP)
LRRELSWPEECIEIVNTTESDGPGNVLAAEASFEHVCERVSATGAHGKPSSRVALEAARMMKDYLATGAVVGRRLADQLLLPMALGGGGTMVTMKPSNHVITNIEVIQCFLPIRIGLEEGERGLWRVEVRREE